jgi:symplekin
MVSKMTNSSKKQSNSEQVNEQNQKIAIVIGKTIAQELKKQELQQHQQKVRLQQSGKTLSGTVKVKQLNLAEITKPLSDEVKSQMALEAVNRILKDDKKVFFSTSQFETRVKLLAMLSCDYHDSPAIPSLIRDYAFEDIRNRSEIIFTTIYNEFLMAKISGRDLTHYSQYLSKTLHDLIEKSELKDRDHFLMKFYTECPLLTDESIELLRHFILSDNLYPISVNTGINILKTLIERKKKLSLSLLSVLLDLCINEKSDVRAQAVKTTKSLHEVMRSNIRLLIEEFALKTLRHLLEPKPPAFIDKENTGLWSDDLIKICLVLYLSLLPTNHKLIHDLAVVYVGTSADTKRIILRVLENPVKGMGMNSPELLLLVENCPKGAETLVTRIIHVLTDKQPPSSELVSRVRDLYQKRVPDVRFLIPVLNGLSKKEVISALPKLIKLNPIVVKEVFNRLLGAHGLNYSFS